MAAADRIHYSFLSRFNESFRVAIREEGFVGQSVEIEPSGPGHTQIIDVESDPHPAAPLFPSEIVIRFLDYESAGVRQVQELINTTTQNDLEIEVTKGGSNYWHGVLNTQELREAEDFSTTAEIRGSWGIDRLRTTYLVGDESLGDQDPLTGVHKLNYILAQLLLPMGFGFDVVTSLETYSFGMNAGSDVLDQAFGDWLAFADPRTRRATTHFDALIRFLTTFGLQLKIEDGAYHAIQFSQKKNASYQSYRYNPAGDTLLSSPTVSPRRTLSATQAEEPDNRSTSVRGSWGPITAVKTSYPHGAIGSFLWNSGFEDTRPAATEGRTSRRSFVPTVWELSPGTSYQPTERDDGAALVRMDVHYINDTSGAEFPQPVGTEPLPIAYDAKTLITQVDYDSAKLVNRGLTGFEFEFIYAYQINPHIVQDRQRRTPPGGYFRKFDILSWRDEATQTVYYLDYDEGDPETAPVWRTGATYYIRWNRFNIGEWNDKFVRLPVPPTAKGRFGLEFGNFIEIRQEIGGEFWTQTDVAGVDNINILPIFPDGTIDSAATSYTNYFIRDRPNILELGQSVFGDGPFDQTLAAMRLATDELTGNWKIDAYPGTIDEQHNGFAYVVNGNLARAASNGTGVSTIVSSGEVDACSYAYGVIYYNEGDDIKAYNVETATFFNIKLNTGLGNITEVCADVFDRIVYVVDRVANRVVGFSMETGDAVVAAPRTENDFELTDIRACFVYSRENRLYIADNSIPGKTFLTKWDGKPFFVGGSPVSHPIVSSPSSTSGTTGLFYDHVNDKLYRIENGLQSIRECNGDGTSDTNWLSLGFTPLALHGSVSDGANGALYVTSADDNDVRRIDLGTKAVTVLFTPGADVVSVVPIYYTGYTGGSAGTELSRKTIHELISEMVLSATAEPLPTMEATTFEFDPPIGITQVIERAGGELMEIIQRVHYLDTGAVEVVGRALKNTPITSDIDVNMELDRGFTAIGTEGSVAAILEQNRESFFGPLSQSIGTTSGVIAAGATTASPVSVGSIPINAFNQALLDAGDIILVVDPFLRTAQFYVDAANGASDTTLDVSDPDNPGTDLSLTQELTYPAAIYVIPSTVRSLILQNKDQIALKVSADGVINAINISSEGIRIAGSRITLDGEVEVGNSIRHSSNAWFIDSDGFNVQVDTVFDPSRAYVFYDPVGSLNRGVIWYNKTFASGASEFGMTFDAPGAHFLVNNRFHVEVQGGAASGGLLKLHAVDKDVEIKSGRRIILDVKDTDGLHDAVEVIGPMEFTDSEDSYIGLPRLTTANRDLIGGSVPAGSLIWNTTTTQVEVFNGSSWSAL